MNIKDHKLLWLIYNVCAIHPLWYFDLYITESTIYTVMINDVITLWTSGIIMFTVKWIIGCLNSIILYNLYIIVKKECLARIWPIWTVNVFILTTLSVLSWTCVFYFINECMSVWTFLINRMLPSFMLVVTIHEYLDAIRVV